MYSIVKRLRIRGVRRSLRDIQADDGTLGHLTMVTVGPRRELKLHGSGDDAQQNPTIPILFDAVLISMHGQRMMVMGFERQGDQGDPLAPTTMQEWSVQFFAEPPVF